LLFAARAQIQHTQVAELDAGTMDEIQKQGLHLFGVVPQSDEVYRYDCDGKPTVQLPEDSPVRMALVRILQNIGL